MTSERGDRFHFIVQVAVSLFFTGVVVGYVLLDKRTFATPTDLAVMMGPVASATLMFVASAVMMPNLLAPGRMAPPLNLTLPVVFALLIRVSVILWASPRSAIFQTVDPLKPALVWNQLGALGLLLSVQFVVLSIQTILHRRTPPHQR